MKINNRQPWESALTEKTVKASGGFIADVNMLETDTKIISSRFPFVRESFRSGYLKQNNYALLPYSGRFGNGYIFAFPHTHSSVRCVYYLDRKQRAGGAVNG